MNMQTLRGNGERCKERVIWWFAHCSNEVKITLLRAYPLYITKHECIKYTLGIYSFLHVQYNNNAFRAVLRLSRFCNVLGMFAEAHSDCTSCVRRLRASSNTVLAMVASRLNCPFIRHCCGRH